MFFKVLHVSRSNERGYLVNQNNLMLQKFDPRPKKWSSQLVYSVLNKLPLIRLTLSIIWQDSLTMATEYQFLMKY